MNAPNLGRRLTYLLGVVVAYSLWKWYTLSNDWKNGSRSLSDLDDSNDKQDDSSNEQDDVYCSTKQNLFPGSGVDKNSPLVEDKDITIYSYHAYDLSEEDDMQSRRDSYNDGKNSNLPKPTTTSERRLFPPQPEEFVEFGM